MTSLKHGIANHTLLDIMLWHSTFDCYKHDLATDCGEYAKERLNEKTNYELVESLSEALEEFIVSRGIMRE